MAGECVRRGLPTFWSMRPSDAVPLIYVTLVDMLAGVWGNRTKVMNELNHKLREPFIVNDETWGMGVNAEEAIEAWERRFPMRRPPGQ